MLWENLKDFEILFYPPVKFPRHKNYQLSTLQDIEKFVNDFNRTYEVFVDEARQITQQPADIAWEYGADAPYLRNELLGLEALSALHRAAWLDRAEIVQALLLGGADMDATTIQYAEDLRTEQTALTIARLRHCSRTVQILFEADQLSLQESSLKSKRNAATDQSRPRKKTCPRRRPWL